MSERDHQIKPEALAAFRVFLDRKPSVDNPPEFPNAQQLNRMLAKSDEFKASHRAIKTPLGWPLNQVFVSKQAKLLYCPIGKNACTFMKSEVARTAQLPNTPYILRDIHFITDHVRTGLQLSDYTEDQVERLINAPQYFKFAVVRDPADRLLSAYIEKFVTGRLSTENRHHTKSVIIPVQNVENVHLADFDKGITFRQFVRYLAQADPSAFDTHWRPQTNYLVGIKYDRLFRIDQLNELMEILEERSGIMLERKARNVTGSGTGIPVAGAADMLPGQIAASPRIARSSFFDGEIQSIVETVFASDYSLLGQT